ncbi:hypothetical protein D3C81_1894330 [compost metagenome]
MDGKSRLWPGTCQKSISTAINSPTSPIRVTIKAFLAAARASGFWYQKPISRNEHTPTSSQKTYSCRRLGDITRLSMEKVNSDR